MRRPGIALQDMALWGLGGVFWAFRHLLSARPGAVLLVPEPLAMGDLKKISPLCPVPYESVIEALEPAAGWRDLLAFDLVEAAQLPLVRAMVGDGAWFVAPLPAFRSRVYRHESGIRLAVAEEFVRFESVKEERHEAKDP